MRTKTSKSCCRLGAILLTALAIAACNGGGSSSPTAPPVVVYPAIAGTWSGNWVVVDLGTESIQVVLAQADSQITGTLTAEGIPIPVTGTLSPRDALGQGVLNWEVPASALDCGFINGSLTVRSGDTRMEGTGRISTVGCQGEPNPLTAEGTITLTRGASTALASQSLGAEGLHRLVRRFAGAAPDLSER